LKFRARQHEFEFPRPALVMGILNVTPDSFSDGGQFFDTQAAISRGEELARQGAEIIDIGGESTRPGATPVTAKEELRRVIPVLEALRARVKVPISVDTMKPEVARASLEAGASMINDVGANRSSPEMWELAAKHGAGYVCMHMQGTPATMQANPVYEDVVREVAEFFFERLKQLNGCGLGREQTILDPGIGFGKTLEHNLDLLRGLAGFAELERPLLVGVSRKSFLSRVSRSGADSRLAASLACACLAVERGAQIIRAHDVAETLQALRMTEALLARDGK